MASNNPGGAGLGFGGGVSGFSTAAGKKIEMSAKAIEIMELKKKELLKDPLVIEPPPQSTTIQAPPEIVVFPAAAAAATMETKESSSSSSFSSSSSSSTATVPQMSYKTPSSSPAAAAEFPPPLPLVKRISSDTKQQNHGQRFYLLRPEFILEKFSFDPKDSHSTLKVTIKYSSVTTQDHHHQTTNNPVLVAAAEQIQKEVAAVNANAILEETKRIVEANRQAALQKLKSRLEKKKKITLKTSERTNPGKLYECKMSNRAQNKTFRLSSLYRHQLHNTERIQTANVASIGSDEFVETFKFNLLDFYSLDDLKEKGCIVTPDGGYLVSDSQLNCGIDELFNCFLDSYGVDNNLMNRDWFKNHFKWIVWKLSAYDKQFLTNERLLSPVNVLLELKYRYDVEIGNGRRSCLRKIIEKDETPQCRLMILFVSRLNLNAVAAANRSNSSSEASSCSFIELCDGWYPIKANCDSYLAGYIKSGRINVGDKLVVYNAELFGCPKDGCSPLEAPSDLHLKLSVNATRKARWFAKLGFVNPQTELKVKLESIKPNAIVGAIDVIIERIYPILYLEKRPDGSRVFRNQRQEEICDYKHQLVMSNSYEDSESSKKAPTNQSAAPIKRNVSPLLKLRLIDYGVTNNSSNNNQSSMLITIWKNVGELREKIKEGQHVKILNVLAIFQKGGYQEQPSVSLSTNNQTSFLFDDRRGDQSIRPSSRTNTDLAELYQQQQQISYKYNELDICGLVITHTETNYQNLVFLSNLDESSQSVVCVSFQKNAEYYGFKEILKVGNVVACLNLRATGRLENQRFPILAAAETSIFTQKLNSFKHMTEGYHSIEEKLKSVDLNEKIEELMEKIKNEKENAVKKPSNMGGSVMTPMTLNNSGIRHPGLVAKTTAQRTFSSTPRTDRILTPSSAINNHLNSNRPVTINLKNSSSSLSVNTPFISSRTLTIKRTSEQMNNANELSMVMASVEEDEDDTILINYDLEALFNGNTSSSTTAAAAASVANNSLVSAKRKKIDK